MSQIYSSLKGLVKRRRGQAPSALRWGQTPMYLANFSGATLPPVTIATTLPTG